MSQQKGPDLGSVLQKIQTAAAHYVNAGRYDDALQIFQKALVSTPKNVALHEGIGTVFLLKDNFPGAGHHYKNAYRLGSRSPVLISRLTVCLHRLDESKNCVALVEKFSGLPGTTAQFDIVAARYFQLQGKYEKANLAANRACAKDPKNKFARATLDSVKALHRTHKNKSVASNLRIAFHMNEPFHYAIMKPIFDAFRNDYPVIMCDDPAGLKTFKPDVIFVANAQATKLRKLFSKATFIYTRHGLISKNFAYEAARTCDFVCLPSEDIHREYVEKGGFNPDHLWVTGYSQMDPLFKGTELKTDLILSKDQSCILYAPTFTDKISSVPLLTPVIEAGNLDRGRQLIIKPHPLSFRKQSAYMARLKKYAEGRSNVHFVDDAGQDITVYMQKADLLVSDASSVMFTYLALDRPIIAINHPDRLDAPQYDPEGIEWRWRDVSDEVDDLEALPALIDHCLTSPHEKSDLRALYRKALFGTRIDGQTGLHIRNALEAVIAKKAEVIHGR